jgi:decaprenylphospho-beta-D-ribofuranose 2-oxidase
MNDVTLRDEEAGLAASQGQWVRLRLWAAGRHASAAQLVCRPDRPARVAQAVPAPEGRSLIARGGGQSHGDAALNDGGAVVLTGRLDRMLSFDAAGGILVAEAGVTLGDVLRTFLPRGWAPAVWPGTGLATLGGAIATDAHGDNHVQAGSFGAHVMWLELVTPRGMLCRASREEAPELFEATVGGMGLTGIIVRAALRLAPVSSAFVTVRHQAAGSLDALLERLGAASVAHAHASAWIDAAATGLARGRGVLQVADPAEAPRRKPRAWHGSWRGPAFPLLPNPVLRLQGERRYRKAARPGGVTFHWPLERFLLEAGRPSAVRLVCVLPLDGAGAAIRRLFDIAERGGALPSAAARMMGTHAGGMLSLARPGVELTLELPAAATLPELMPRLEREILDREGRVALASDAYLTDHGFAAMYPRLEAFRAVLTHIDPDMRLQSDLARRLRLRDYVV